MNMMLRHTIFCAFAAVLVSGLAAGCEKEGKIAVLVEWQKLGLEASGFDPVDGAAFAGGSCQKGKVESVETVVCEYKTPKDAQNAQSAGYKHVGMRTGASLVANTLLLVVVDTENVDPAGKNINKITKAFLTLAGDDAPGTLKKKPPTPEAKSGDEAK